MITFRTDDLTPCLQEVATGEIVATDVTRISDVKSLRLYNKKTGWYVNWSQFDSDIEIYSVRVQGEEEHQGLVAIEEKKGDGAIHIVWACVAPHNNPKQNKEKKYIGTGGHLFAIAGSISKKRGYGGVVYGEAASKKLLEYYIDEFGAVSFPYGFPPHPYRMAIGTEQMEKILEVYTYDSEEDAT